MNKKKNLLNIFTKDVSYNYHLIKTNEPTGHLIYLIKNTSDLNVETLEFSTNKIAEELVSECSVVIEKFAPSIYFTNETDTINLRKKLNLKLSEKEEFSKFIETIKNEYRILEIKDSLLFKKDPEAYEQLKKKEYEEHQKELWEKMMEQLEKSHKKREEHLLSYENDLMKLLKEYFEPIIEFEKRDFNLDVELEKIIKNLIDPKTWIKINDVPFTCRIEVISLEKDKIYLYLTDNNNYNFTATLRFDKNILITENIKRIDKHNLPTTLFDYDIIIQLYDMDKNSIDDWDYKNNTDRFNYVIDYLVPIFKENKRKAEEEVLNKIEKENLTEESY